jgi:hypothetical protein
MRGCICAGRRAATGCRVSALVFMQRSALKSADCEALKLERARLSAQSSSREVSKIPRACPRLDLRGSMNGDGVGVSARCLRRCGCRGRLRSRRTARRSS